MNSHHFKSGRKSILSDHDCTVVKGPHLLILIAVLTLIIFVLTFAADRDSPDKLPVSMQSDEQSVLPHFMTETEKSLYKNYRPPLVGEKFTDPPPYPVRAMAEWEELQGIMITWTAFPHILSQIVDYAQEEGIVYIVCSDSNSVKNYLTISGVPHNNIEFLIEPYNSIWIRDYGPWSAYTHFADTLNIIDWIYNRPRPDDDVIPQAFAGYIGAPFYSATEYPYDLIHSGGNFMVDGHGNGFSSKLILDENPGKTEAEIDTIMKKYLGINRYIKMETLPYDVIHHIDMHMKLLDEETLLVGQYPPGIADGPQIEANLQYILNNFQTCHGRPFKVVRIPMPPENGQYPPIGDYRTYTNSIIINKTVIIPTYEYQYDTTAFRIYRDAMPGYNIVGINSNSIIPYLGAIHCIVKEVGVKDPIFISHASLDTGAHWSQFYPIQATIKNSAGILAADVQWTIDTTLGFNTIPMTTTSSGTFFAEIPQQSVGTKVFYYISAQSITGKTVSKPITAPLGNYRFVVDSVSLIPIGLVHPHLLNFDTTTVDTTLEMTLHVKNTGTYMLDVFDVISTDSAFSVNISNFSVNPGDSQEVKVTFSPLQAGDYSGMLYFLSNHPGTDTLNATVTGVAVAPNFILNNRLFPASFTLKQNYPNPFNPSTRIEFSLPQQSLVSLKIYNVLGEEVATVVSKKLNAGSHVYAWDASGVAGGVYYYRLKAGDFIQTKKLVLLK